MTTDLLVRPDVLVPPAHLWVPPRVGSLGDDIAGLAGDIGLPVDPEQRLAIDAITSYRSGGRWAALETCLIEGRQNGKTEGVLLPIVLADLMWLEPDQVSWTAHLFRTTRKTFEKFKLIIETCPLVSAEIRKVNEGRGEESIVFTNGAQLDFLARVKGGGRGLGGKRIVLDEALYLAGTSLGALIPTLSARPNPQVMYASSAGVGESEHLRRLRDRGRPGGDPSLVYIEWCAPEGGCLLGKACTHVIGSVGCALDDETLWPLANHSMARGRITVEFVRAERRALPVSEFARERAGWWDKPLLAEKPIDVVAWAALVKSRRRKPRDAQVVFFVDVGEGMASAAIGVAFEVRGRPYVEIADHRAGTGWLVKRCRQLAKRNPDAAWFGGAQGPVGAFAPDLADDEADVQIDLEVFSTSDMARGYSHLQGLIKDERFAHSGDQSVTVAINGAVKRDVGDGLWLVERRKSESDITPLNATAGALWGLKTYEGSDFAVVIGEDGVE